MAPDPELTAKVMKLRWKKGLSLKEAWAQVKRPKKKKEDKPKKKKEDKPKKKKEEKPKPKKKKEDKPKKKK
tara:strand:- start:61 stop:273 length:213 start_codon:yes stop_codon:yes gene_type:complete